LNPGKTAFAWGKKAPEKALGFLKNSPRSKNSRLKAEKFPQKRKK
jgi:hypothetical protein